MPIKRYNGTSWDIVAGDGLQGPTGPAGPTGPSGTPTLTQNNLSGAYTLAASDNGKLITSNGYTLTINSSTAWPVGYNCMVYNTSGGAVTVTQGSGVVITWAGAVSTGSRTIGPTGAMTILCVGTNSYLVSGPGVF